MRLPKRWSFGLVALATSLAVTLVGWGPRGILLELLVDAPATGRASRMVSLIGAACLWPVIWAGFWMVSEIKSVGSSLWDQKRLLRLSLLCSGGVALAGGASSLFFPSGFSFLCHPGAIVRSAVFPLKPPASELVVDPRHGVFLDLGQPAFLRSDFWVAETIVFGVTFAAWFIAFWGLAWLLRWTGASVSVYLASCALVLALTGIALTRSLYSIPIPLLAILYVVSGAVCLLLGVRTVGAARRRRIGVN